MPQLTFLFVGITAVSILVYWLIPSRRQTLFLAVASTAFVIMLDVISYAILLLLTVVVFFFSRKTESKRIFSILLIGLVLIFAGVRMIQLLQRIEHGLHWLVLLGFGFYILKLIHYWVERQANTFRQHSFLEFYNYMLFFPTITVGPIHRFEEFLRSQRRMRWNDAMFARGLERTLFGYVKVVVIANWLIALQLYDLVYALDPGPSGWSTLLDSAVYGFHLYFTFSGYSDIAIGLGLLFGYEICENFNHPFLRKNIGEFWQSWHMSLSAWCRQYVFLPVFTHSRNLSLALLATMVTLGLWHEFSARYLLWGAYHGIGLLIWRLYQRKFQPKFQIWKGPGWAVVSGIFSIGLTFSFVMLGFTIPRSSSLQEIVQNFQLILGGW